MQRGSSTILATNIARFGRVRRTSQTLPCPHLCCVTEGGLQDLSSLAGYGDAARMGRAFLAHDPGLVRTYTDAGICCALFACSYPFSSCGLCVSVMQVAGWQQKQECALRWANAPPKEKGEFEERVRQVEVAMSDWRPPPHERVPQVEVAMSDQQPPQLESLRLLSESQPEAQPQDGDWNDELQEGESAAGRLTRLEDAGQLHRLSRWEKHQLMADMFPE